MRRASRAWRNASASTSVGEAVDLGFELEGGDKIGRARHLEVHVAESVLCAQDVSQGDESAALLDQPHGDAPDRRLNGHAGVHLDGGDPHTEAIDVEPLEDKTSETRRST